MPGLEQDLGPGGVLERQFEPARGGRVVPAAVAGEDGEGEGGRQPVRRRQRATQKAAGTVRVPVKPGRAIRAAWPGAGWLVQRPPRQGRPGAEADGLDGKAATTASGWAVHSIVGVE